MAKSSIHIQPIKASSESHNLRETKLDYVREDLTKNNYSWTQDSISNLRKEIKILVKEKTGRTMQKKATPYREGVFLFTEEHTDEDLKKVVLGVEKEFGIKAVQLHVHRDEGHYSIMDGKWKPNLHAHVIFEWINRDTGKSFKLSREEMSKLQTYFALSLGMERGVKTLKKHLNSRKFKALEERKKAIQLQKVINKQKETIENNKKVIEKLTPREKTELTAYRLLADNNPKLKEAVKKAIPHVRKMNKSRGNRI